MRLMSDFLLSGCFYKVRVKAARVHCHIKIGGTNNEHFISL